MEMIDFFNALLIKVIIFAIIILLLGIGLKILIQKFAIAEKFKIFGSSKRIVNRSLQGSNLKLSEASPKGFIFGLQGRKKVYLPNNQEGHIVVFGGSGKGKTSALLIPSLRAWDGPFFTIDISGDISRNVNCPKKTMLSPDEPENSIKYDIFSVIDSCDDEDIKREKIEILVNLVIPIDPKGDSTDKYFAGTARKLFLGTMIAFYDIGMDFIEICKEAYFNTTKELIEKIEATENEYAIAYIASLKESNEKNVAGAKDHLEKHIKLFADNPNMEKIISRSPVDETGIPTENRLIPAMLEEAQIFFKIPDAKQEYYTIFEQIVINQMLDYISQRAYNPSADKRILIAIDEFASVGHLELLGPFRKFRKNGGNIVILTQSLADIDITYNKEERKVILDNAAYTVVLSANDIETRQYFSDSVGKEDHTKTSTSQSATGSSTSTSIQEEHAVHLNDWRFFDKDLVVIHPGGYIKLKKNYYFK